MKTSYLFMKNQTFFESFFVILFAAILISAKSTPSIAQQDEYLCTKGLSYGELQALFHIYNTDKLKSILSQKCFNEIESSLPTFTTYERKYEKTIGDVVHHYNELFILSTRGAYEYKCAELDLCYKLLKQINDDAIFYSWLEDETYMYILKNQTHVLEMRDIPDKNIGYAYGFKLRPVNTNDWDRLRAKKLADNFPANTNEREKLEYRYARVDALSKSTTLDINVGDKLSFNAGGKIKFGAFAGQGGPNGINGFTAYNKINGFRHGSLLYRIGNGDWDYVTNEIKNIRANNAGRLQLIVNDGSPSDNEGLFWVNIKLIRSQ